MSEVAAQLQCVRRLARRPTHAHERHDQQGNGHSDRGHQHNRPAHDRAGHDDHAGGDDGRRDDGREGVGVDDLDPIHVTGEAGQQIPRARLRHNPRRLRPQRRKHGRAQQFQCLERNVVAAQLL